MAMPWEKDYAAKQRSFRTGDELVMEELTYLLQNRRGRKGLEFSFIRPCLHTEVPCSGTQA
jgi:hypothetical protein